MHRLCSTLCCSLVLSTLAWSGWSHTTPAQEPSTAPANQEPYTFRVEVVERTARAVNYRHRGGATKVDFKGTQLLPDANGEAKVEAKEGYTEIEVEFDDLQPPTKFGPEYLTYVLWAVTPQGRANNIGEVVLDGNRSKLNVTTELPAFAMVVTAEPHFAVTQPSNVVVMENVLRPDTVGRAEIISTKYELLDRASYSAPAQPEPSESFGSLSKFTRDQQQPVFYVVQARNAIRIARNDQAERFAPEVLKRAETLLAQSENYLKGKQWRPTITVAKEATQSAEAARVLALRRAEAARIQAEREEAARRQQEAETAAAEAARRRAEAEEQQRLEAERRAQAERQAEESRLKSLEAQLAAERAARERAEAEARQQTLAAEAERSRQAAQAAEAERLRVIEEQRAARERLRQQLNAILETRESARGLIVNMSDVLFEFGKWSLKPAAKLKLAKVAGILLGHPTLSLQIEGHTDNVGSDEFNQRLSQRRADSVKEFLVSQGVAEPSISTVGLGESAPVAPNNTAAGRQQNRRVEVVVSGEEIGVQASAPTE